MPDALDAACPTRAVAECCRAGQIDQSAQRRLIRAKPFRTHTWASGLVNQGGPRKSHTMVNLTRAETCSIQSSKFIAKFLVAGRCNSPVHIPHLPTYTGHWFHKHQRLPVTPEIFLHLIETNIFEKITLDQVVANAILGESDPPPGNQQILL